MMLATIRRECTVCLATDGFECGDCDDTHGFVSVMSTSIEFFLLVIGYPNFSGRCHSPTKLKDIAPLPA